MAHQSTAPRQPSPTKAKENGKNGRTLKFQEAHISRLSHISGFPHFIETRHRFPIEQVYGRGLLSSGNGYPLWSPGTHLDLPSEYYRHGISIGDVGLIYELGGGAFHFSFNIFLPADHPYNKGRTPESFVPLAAPDPSEIRRTANYFPPGFVMTSNDIKISRNPQKATDMIFESSASQGVIMMLPDGAAREDLTAVRMNEYIKEHAVAWYRFWGPVARNGSLFVVTGCDKATSLSVFSYPFPLLKDYRLLKDGIKISCRNGRLQQTHPQKTYGQSFFYKPELGSEKLKNLCVFLRGIHIFLGDSEWIQCMGSQRINHYLELSDLVEPTIAAANSRPVNNEAISASSRESLSDDSPTSDISSFDNDRRDTGSESSDEGLFHLGLYTLNPSVIVAQILLCEFPATSMVLLDDAIWSIWPNAKSEPSDVLASTFQCPPPSITELSTLIARIFHLHSVVEHDGALRLVRNSKREVSRTSWASRLRDLVFQRKSAEKNWAKETIYELIRQGQNYVGSRHDY